MGHWIIRDEGFDGSFYECSNCGARWCDLYSSPGLYDRCPRCGVEFSEENEYICDLNNTPIAKEEKKEEQTISEYFASFGKTTLDWLKNCIVDDGGFMVISRKEYDEMKDKIRSLTNELAIKEIEYKDNIKHMTDLFVRIGISADVWNKIDQESLEVLEDQNPYNCTTKYMIKFDARRY